MVYIRIWIGLDDSDVSRQFRWINNGYLLQWTNWNSNYRRPTDVREIQCVSRQSNGEWIERFCDDQLHFYCEQKGMKNIAYFPQTKNIDFIFLCDYIKPSM